MPGFNLELFQIESRYLYLNQNRMYQKNQRAAAISFVM